MHEMWVKNKIIESWGTEADFELYGMEGLSRVRKMAKMEGVS
jgi:hypothetical protein